MSSPFLKHSDIEAVIGAAKEFGSRPSDIIAIADPLTRYCFDTACWYLYAYLSQGEKPAYENHKTLNTGLKTLMSQ